MDPKVENKTDTENQATPGRFAGRGRWLALAGVLIVGVVMVYLWVTAGRVSTDDAQVDGHITQVAARVGGTVTTVNVKENQYVEAGTVLLELDPRDYQVAVDRARAELADAEANASGAATGIPLTQVSTESNLRTATGGVEEAQAGVAVADRQVEAARAQLVAAQARQREKEATAAKAAKDVDRLKGLAAKEEIAQQQYDAAISSSESARASADAARSDVSAAEVAVSVAEQRARQARGAAAQAQGALQASQTGPEQLRVTKARADVANARVQQMTAALAQAELNLQRTKITAPSTGVVSRKTVEVGQVIQAGQPLFALVSLGDVWVTANYKETQLQRVQAGQRAKIAVDGLDRVFDGHVDSIAAATGAKFSLLPPENATGNYVKVVQRLPVKIVFEPGQDPDHRLRPGMSVTPTIDTNNSSR
ncbi:MAG TPA: HlyD family secretion protein [Vicinamibacterales bacterium]|nr:HlyD family secretion protein [Vicinamibacterales bacterium]